MSRSKRLPLVHRGIQAQPIHPSAPIDKKIGRETHRAPSLESEVLMLDFFTVLEFDLRIQYFQRQPVQIDYFDACASQRSFTPEFLITYRRDIEPAFFMKPLLCDVLVRADVFNKWPDFRHRARASNNYAQGRNWSYRILTEREIRTPYLDNARLLLPYRSLRSESEYDRLLLNSLHKIGLIKVQALLNLCSNTGADVVKLGNSLFQLIALGWVRTDLRKPFCMQSNVWIHD